MPAPNSSLVIRRSISSGTGFIRPPQQIRSYRKRSSPWSRRSPNPPPSLCLALPWLDSSTLGSADDDRGLVGGVASVLPRQTADWRDPLRRLSRFDVPMQGTGVTPPKL